MNNLSKFYNATIFLQKNKPIITMFYWIKTYIMGTFYPDALAALLNDGNIGNNVVVDIYPISIDISYVKPTPCVKLTPSNSVSVRTFIGNAPKVAKSNVFKPPRVVKPNTSDHVSVLY